MSALEGMTNVLEGIAEAMNSLASAVKGTLGYSSQEEGRVSKRQKSSGSPGKSLVSLAQNPLLDGTEEDSAVSSEELTL